MHLERQQEGEGDYVEVMKDDDTYFQTTRPASPSNSVNKAKGWNGWQYWKKQKVDERK